MKKHNFYSREERPRVPLIALANVPVALRRRAQWIAWVLVRKGADWVKVPVACKNGRVAKTNDPKTWTTFEEASGYYERCHPAGIGFVFSAEDPFVGIDLDDVRNPLTGELDARAQRLIEQCKTYAEISPSGTGLKLYGTGRLDDGCSHKIGKVEVYDRLRFFAVTGNRIAGPREPRDCQRIVNALLERMKRAKTAPRAARVFIFGGDRSRVIDRARAYLRRIPPAISGQQGHDRTFYVAMRLVQGFALSDDEALATLDAWNQTCEPPWSESELAHKVRSARARIDPARLGEFLQDRAKGRVG